MPFSPKRAIRLDKEPIFRDPKYLSLDPELQLLLLSLLHYVDGTGRENASSTLIRELLYEFRADVTPSTVDEWLLRLEAESWLLIYEHGRRLYLQINPSAWAAFVSGADGRDSRLPAPEPGPVAAQGTPWGDPGRPPAEGKGEAGERDSRWMLDPDMPPPQGCPLHPHNTGLIKCGPCGGARTIHTQFMSGEISHEEAVAAWRQAGPRRAREEER